MKKTSRLYLQTLRIQNFATFTQQEVHFGPHFNGIVGETGSGKSLLLDALELIFGSRADKKSIRKGSKFASVEATFKTSDTEIKKYFEQIGHPFEGDEIIVKRVIFQQESSKSFLNFQACSLSTLSQFSKRYIDLVGQFENQKLLSDDYQLVLLDHYAKNEKSLEDYQKMYFELQSLIEKKNKLEQLAQEKAQREDFLKFQLDEIESLSPTLEDESELLRKKEVITNWQKQKTTFEEILNLLSDNEQFNSLYGIHQAIKLSTDVQDVKNLNNEDLQTAKNLIEDYCFELSKNLEFEFNDEDLEHTLDRLDQYQKLKRKYGGQTQDILNAYEQYKEELSKLNVIDNQITELQNKIECLEQECQKSAKKLHDQRVQKAKELSKKLTASVQSLKMIGASMAFDTQIKKDLGPKGFSHITLMAETNPGEGFFKVKQIASGGELSRILLALRQILSTHDSISVFLFDEIDSGVGGETALSVGSALQSVSTAGQVIAITHLPQIAKFCDTIIKVEKDVNLSDKKTISHVHNLEGQELSSFVQSMSSI